jgi:hypothetical protein
MAIDRVRPIKQESAATGGDPADDVEFLQAPVQSNEDAIDVRGVYLQNDTSNNTAALITRDSSDNITLTDPNAGTYTLSQLAAGGAGLTANQHRNLLQLIHFIDEGPAEGFVTGATKTVTGTVFPTSVIWRRADTTKLVEQTITWSGIVPTTIEWKMYDTNGTTVLATVSDAVSYSGPFETGRTRTIS